MKPAFGFVALLSIFAVHGEVRAQDFATGVSPPRFELTAKGGDRLRQVVEISNASPQAARLRIKTADWALEPDYAVSFFEALQPAAAVLGSRWSDVRSPFPAAAGIAFASKSRPRRTRLSPSAASRF